MEELLGIDDGAPLPSFFDSCRSRDEMRGPAKVALHASLGDYLWPGKNWITVRASSARVIIINRNIRNVDTPGWSP
jgi:hypothetical protein